MINRLFGALLPAPGWVDMESGMSPKTGNEFIRASLSFWLASSFAFAPAFAYTYSDGTNRLVQKATYAQSAPHAVVAPAAAVPSVVPKAVKAKSVVPTPVPTSEPGKAAVPTVVAPEAVAEPVPVATTLTPIEPTAASLDSVPTKAQSPSGAPDKEAKLKAKTAAAVDSLAAELKAEEPKPDQAAIEPSTMLLSGHASNTIVRAELGKIVSDMLAKSLSEDSDFKEIEAEQKKKHPFRKVMSKVGGIVGEVVSINASSTSKDGAKIILDETDDWDEKDALTLQKQKMIDELHPKIAGALLQVAMGKGNPIQSDNARTMAEKGLSELTTLVGSGAREVVDSSMKRWMSEVEVNPPKDAPVSDLITTHKNLGLLTEAAVQDDPTLLEIRKELEHFARPNKVKDTVNNTLQTMLDTTAYMMPTAGIAAAVVAVKGVLVVSTGGGEEDKLQHLMFLVKRISSRTAALKEEIQLALYGREVGLQTNNKLLVKCADAVIGNLVTPKAVHQVLRKIATKDEEDDD